MAFSPASRLIRERNFIHCVGGIGEVTDTLRVYIVAEDDLPTNQNVGDRCSDLSSQGTTTNSGSCFLYGVVVCNQVVDDSKPDTVNRQSGEFNLWEDSTAGMRSSFAS